MTGSSVRNEETHNKVSLIKCQSYDYDNVRASIRKVFDEFPIDFDGKKVVVKPNLLLARGPENASTTHPTIIRAVCEEAICRGGSVIIAESGGGPITKASLEKLYGVTGMKDAAEQSGAILNYSSSMSQVDIPEGKKRQSFNILKVIADADIVINVAKLKTHGLMLMTGAVKNNFGVIPGLNKAVMHSELPGKSDFASMIVDLCLAVKPALSIVDGIVGMEGEGPSGGTPKKANVIISSRNPFSADIAGAYIMKIPYKDVPILSEAVSRGLTPGDIKQLVITGESISDIATEFKLPNNRKTIVGLLPGILRYPIEDATRAYPYISERCVSCGRCAAICPQKTISKAENRFSVNIKNCIRCYCCHEICPEKAIDMCVKRKYPKSIHVNRA